MPLIYTPPLPNLLSPKNPSATLASGRYWPQLLRTPPIIVTISSHSTTGTILRGERILHDGLHASGVYLHDDGDSDV